MSERDTIIREILEDLGYYNETWIGILKDEFMKLLKLKYEALLY